MTSIRPILASAWMGIQHDIAWTTPPLSLSLRAIAPFASAMTVCIIYWFGTTNSAANLFSPRRLAFVLIGSTLYAHIASYAWVPTEAIAEGKNLSVFPHIYLTSRSTAFYVAGRALSAFVISTITSGVAMILAYFAIGAFTGTQIPVTVTPVSMVMVGLALLANIPAAFGLGYLLGAYSLYASKFEWSLPGYVSGLLMVFSGALFPTSILPWPLSVGANYLPFTQFIVTARSALLPGSGDYASAMALCLLGGTVLFVGSLMVYFAAERKARRDGVIDRRLA